MKKMIFSAACLSASFMFLAFSPAEKNNNVDNVITEDIVAAAGCAEFNETITEFTRCYKISTMELSDSIDSQAAVLNGL